MLLKEFWIYWLIAALHLVQTHGPVRLCFNCLNFVANSLLIFKYFLDVDHTCYTISTAGSEGFLSLLPVYLDHILYPTLKVCGLFVLTHANKNKNKILNHKSDV